MKIAKDSTIGEVVQKHPFAGDIMLGYGLHCVGCHVAFDETLEQGANAHGMSPDEIDKMVASINDRIELLERSKKERITITEEAKKTLKEALEKEKKAGVKVKVVGSSDGFANYEMSFADKAEDDEEALDVSGIKFFVHKEEAKKLKGIMLDFVSTVHGSGFKVYDNEPVHSCGCCG